MIRYTLKCSAGHRFESWFADSGTYDRLAGAGHVSCAICGDDDVVKAMMAPRVSAAEEESAPLTANRSPTEIALRALREKVEAESDYVGKSFASEARRIHDGESDERPIWGEATQAEAKALIDDGIPVAPLPFGPRKTH